MQDLDNLYSDMLAARVDNYTRWEALKLMIKAIVPDIDDARHPRRDRHMA